MAAGGTLWGEPPYALSFFGFLVLHACLHAENDSLNFAFNKRGVILSLGRTKDEQKEIKSAKYLNNPSVIFLENATSLYTKEANVVCALERAIHESPLRVCANHLFRGLSKAPTPTEFKKIACLFKNKKITSNPLI